MSFCVCGSRRWQWDLNFNWLSIDLSSPRLCSLLSRLSHDETALGSSIIGCNPSTRGLGCSDGSRSDVGVSFCEIVCCALSCTLVCLPEFFSLGDEELLGSGEVISDVCSGVVAFNVGIGLMDD